MPPSPPQANLRRCCRCNRTAKCIRCACVRNRKPCSGCLPGVHDRCQNRVHLTTPTPTPPTSPPCQDPEPPAYTATPPSTTASSLPSLTTILQTHIPTLQHVPKGARDCWSRALSECLLLVANDPVDLTHWCKLFMLPKCVLANPAAGHRLPWREIFQQVRSRLRRWLADDLLSLWMEAVDNGQIMSQRLNSSKASSSSQRSHNARRARRAVQDGLYSKAIKALTSVGLAPPSPEVLKEMLEKHPQAPPSNFTIWPGASSLFTVRFVCSQCSQIFP